MFSCFILAYVLQKYKFFNGDGYTAKIFFLWTDLWKVKNPDAVKRFAKHLKKLRNEKGYSQQELADMANINKRTLQEIEGFKLNPSLDTLLSLSGALEIPLKELVDFEG